MLWRVVGSPEIMRDQLEHLHHLATQPHITLQVLPHDTGAHPGLAGQFSILHFAEAADTVVHLERFTSDLYLEKRSDVQHYTAMHAHLQTRALDEAHTVRCLTDAIKSYIGRDFSSTPVLP